MFRVRGVLEYRRGGRKETPACCANSSPHFRPLMEAFGFVTTECLGFEADDVIGTLATRRPWTVRTC
ncbi:MAG: hypothetical protein U0Y82_08845 [Thermoleophilia bacterium]